MLAGEPERDLPRGAAGRAWTLKSDGTKKVDRETWRKSFSFEGLFLLPLFLLWRRGGGGPKLFCLCCRGKTRLVTLRGRRGHRERSLSLDSRRGRERRERKEREGEKQSGFFLLFSFLALTRAHNRSRYSSPLPSVFSFQRPSLSRGGKASTRGLDCYCTRQIPSLSPLPHSKRAG